MNSTDKLATIFAKDAASIFATITAWAYGWKTICSAVLLDERIRSLNRKGRKSTGTTAAGAIARSV
jgi:hypothetical protein